MKTLVMKFFNRLQSLLFCGFSLSLFVYTCLKIAYTDNSIGNFKLREVSYVM